MQSCMCGASRRRKKKGGGISACSRTVEMWIFTPSLSDLTPLFFYIYFVVFLKLQHFENIPFPVVSCSAQRCPCLKSRQTASCYLKNRAPHQAHLLSPHHFPLTEPSHTLSLSISHSVNNQMLLENHPPYCTTTCAGVWKERTEKSFTDNNKKPNYTCCAWRDHVEVCRVSHTSALRK